MEVKDEVKLFLWRCGHHAFGLFGAGGAGAKRKRRRGDTQLREHPRPGGDPSLKV
jgi:hypothetical protein